MVTHGSGMRTTFTHKKKFHQTLTAAGPTESLTSLCSGYSDAPSDLLLKAVTQGFSLRIGQLSNLQSPESRDPRQVQSITVRTSLVVQWLKNPPANSGDMGSISGLGKYYMGWGS